MKRDWLLVACWLAFGLWIVSFCTAVALWTR